MTNVAVNDQALAQIFRDARTQNKWLADPVSDAQLEQLYDLTKMGPTSANSGPARFVFLKSEEAKERLRPLLMANNAEKMMSAPVVAIIAYDLDFHDRLPELFPAGGEAYRGFFASNEQLHFDTAYRNSSLQGAYLMIAARALGLDCGPISGFDNAGVDREFFPEGRLKSNFICAIGHGDPEGVWPRNPRLSFADACKVL